ncbi:hypothetical protein [Lysobacter sp. F6437]|uniref:hypothetical protein n=1 Tax=Lysobacter sp. F6437 TaxID=3459296 RepID=UPI00403E0627
MPRRTDQTLLPPGFSRRVVLVALGLSCALAWPPHAAAQVNRCEHTDGTIAYTDHRCRDIGAVERLPSPDRIGSHRTYRGGCARNVQDLLFEMTTAIDGGDANRLASVYHWAGMSSRGATAVMDRLATVVRRPLVDIVPVVPEPQPPPLPVFTRTVGDAGVVEVAEVGERYYPSTVTDARPVALRVVQTLGNGVTPSETVFGLHRHFGCLWIRN